MPIAPDGIWRRNVPWVRSGVGTSDIQRNILMSPQLREAHYLFSDGEIVIVGAEDLRRSLAGAPSRLGSKLGPYSIDPAKGTINGVKVAMRSGQARPNDIVKSDGELPEISSDKNETLGDGVERVLRMVQLRRGQPAFRQALFRAYDGRCTVSDVGISDLLEACHILPYAGFHSNEPSNGLLLRADLHTLFDLHLLSVHPVDLVACFHPRIRSDLHVAHLHGRAIRIPRQTSLRPAKFALAKHYDQYVASTSNTV